MATNFFRKQRADGRTNVSNRTSTSDPTVSGTPPADLEKEAGPLETYKPKWVTGWTLIMTVLAAMAGCVFGYDTGQISGFLEMQVFLERFGQRDSQGNYYFSNVRSGLIVGLVSRSVLYTKINLVKSNQLTSL
jgi:hypothetical protein